MTVGGAASARTRVHTTKLFTKVRVVVSQIDEYERPAGRDEAVILCAHGRPFDDTTSGCLTRPVRYPMAANTLCMASSPAAHVTKAEPRLQSRGTDLARTYRS